MEIIKKLSKYENPQQAIISNKFFKTQKGEYAEGDIFLVVSLDNNNI